MSCQCIWKQGKMGSGVEPLKNFANPRPIIQWETPCLNIDMHPVLVENGR